ncbi:MAG: DUF2807 domain-containing protein [Bacteroidetes bacterium]|nr:DUF2807 domain-containing protein [Bacteroidota bacterium]
MKSIVLLIILAATTILYTGCEDIHCIEGNEMVVVDTRPIGSFTGISSESWFNVIIIQDSVNEVVVEAESNLLPYIDTWVEGTTLVLKEQHRRCLNNHYPVIITVRTKDINFIRLSGSGDIYGNNIFNTDYLRVDLSGSGQIDLAVNANNVESSISGSGSIKLGVTAEHLESTISGSGEFQLSGDVHKGDMNITGSGNIHAYGLIQDICVATITGSGNMFLTVHDLLDVRITGSGSVHYKGNPTVTLNITGSGSVIHEN